MTTIPTSPIARRIQRRCDGPCGGVVDVWSDEWFHATQTNHLADGWVPGDLDDTEIEPDGAVVLYCGSFHHGSEEHCGGSVTVTAAMFSEASWEAAPALLALTGMHARLTA